MSTTAAPPPPAGPAGAGAPGRTAAGPAAGEACPLCGAPLDPSQEWCLRCGAAARTRLAASSNWKAPIIAFAVVAVLSLGVLAASLVKLSSGSGSTTTTIHRTVTVPPAAAAPTTTAAAPVPTTPAPSSSTPNTPLAGAGTGSAAAQSAHRAQLEAIERTSRSVGQKKRVREQLERLRPGK